jgi:hypothetical protein
VVQFVVDDEGIAGAYIDQPERATKHAKRVNGVVVPVAFLEDHRTPPTQEGN